MDDPGDHTEPPLECQERWFRADAAQRLRRAFEPRFRELSDGIFGHTALHLGPPVYDLDHLRIQRVVRVRGRPRHRENADDAAEADPASGCRTVDVCCSPGALPFGNDGVDGALLMHALDLCDRPHAVLRESARVLRSGGLLILQGLHPLSVYALRREWHRRATLLPGLGPVLAGRAPPLATRRQIWPGRIVDWLQLLGFAIEHPVGIGAPPGVPARRSAVGSAAAPGSGDSDAGEGDPERQPRLPTLYLIRARKLDPAFLHPRRVPIRRPLIVPLPVPDPAPRVLRVPGRAPDGASAS